MTEGRRSAALGKAFPRKYAPRMFAHERAEQAKPQKEKQG